MTTFLGTRLWFVGLKHVVLCWCARRHLGLGRWKLLCVGSAIRMRNDCSRSKVFMKNLNSNIRIFIFTVSAILVASVFFFFPGILTPDSLHQLAEARSGTYTSAHPPSMAILWGMLLNIVPQGGGIIIVHLLVFWCGWGLIVYSLVANRTAKYLFLLVPLWPTFYYQFSTVLKDVGMVSFATMAMGLFVFWERGRRRRWIIICSVLFALYALSVRHNAIGLLLPMFCIAALKLYPQKKLSALIISIAMVSLAWAGVQGVGVAISKNTTSANIGRLMSWDLVGASVKSQKNFVKDLDIFNVENPDLAKVYSSRCIDMMYSKGFDFNKSSQELGELKKRWFSMLKLSPFSYIEHRWAVMSSHLGFTASATHMPGWIPSEKNNKLMSSFYGAISWMNHETIFFKPYVYIIFSLILGSIFGFNLLGFGAIVFSHGCIMLTLFPVLPCADFRYSLGHLLLTMGVLLFGYSWKYKGWRFS